MGTRLLFHKDVFMPDGVASVCEKMQRQLSSYKLSSHFKEHLSNQLVEDRSHTYLEDVVVDCIDSIKNDPKEAFEVEMTNTYGDIWLVTKYCCRVPYSKDQDLVVVIRPMVHKGKVIDNLVVTAWMNSNSDHHFTLDDSKYCSKNEWESLSKTAA